MATIEFGPWMPDQPRLNNPCVTAQNVYPIATGYAPFPSAEIISDALGDICTGSICFKRSDGTVETFAGTANDLYRLDGESWTAVSKSGGYLPANAWRFAVYGGRLIATNGVNNPQKFDLDSDTVFSDLSNAPKHRYPIVVRDVLVALDVTDGSDPIAFSAVNNSEQWDADDGAGTQPLPDGGPVVGGVGGEYGIIFQEQAILRMNFVGGDLRFTFDKVEGAMGCVAPDSIIQYKGRIFYLSDEGFQVFTGSESENISTNAVSDYFSDTYLDGKVSGALDPANSSVVWSRPGPDGGFLLKEDGDLILKEDGDSIVLPAIELLIYNYRVQRWSEALPPVTQLHTGIEDGGEVLRGFNVDNELVEFTGAAMSATVSTGDLQLAKGRRASVSAVRGLVDSTHTATVGKKTDLADTEVTTSGNSNSNGKVSLRANARYHRIQIQPTATWTELTGAELEVAVSGGR